MCVSMSFGVRCAVCMRVCACISPLHPNGLYSRAERVNQGITKSTGTTVNICDDLFRVCVILSRSLSAIIIFSNFHLDIIQSEWIELVIWLCWLSKPIRMHLRHRWLLGYYECASERTPGPLYVMRSGKAYLSIKCVNWWPKLIQNVDCKFMRFLSSLDDETRETITWLRWAMLIFLSVSNSRSNNWIIDCMALDVNRTDFILSIYSLFACKCDAKRCFAN